MEQTVTLTEKQMPVVSIITVVYNGELYIEKTIQSVLAQHYPNLEYIIIDGGSTDRTLDIIRNYEISKVISGPDHGIYDAMNKGLAIATGDWVNFLNGGDVFENENVLLNLFHVIPEGVDLIYGDSINIAPGFRKRITPGSLSRNSLRRSMGICHQALFVRRKIAPKYNLSYRYKAEYNWVLDIMYSNPLPLVYHWPHPVVCYALGGFSEIGIVKNLREFIGIGYSRFGIIQVLKNLPIYITVCLRSIKYRLIGYGQSD